MPLTVHVVINAVSSSSLSCFEYLHRCSPELFGDAPIFAAHYNNVQALEMLNGWGIPMDMRAARAARVSRSDKALRWLVANGKPVDILSLAYMSGQ